MVNIYWSSTCMYIDTIWTWYIWLCSIFGLSESNNNVFRSIVDLVSLYCIFSIICLRKKQESDITLYVSWCVMFSGSLVGVCLWIFSLRKLFIQYELWKVLHFFSDLLVTLGYLAWNYLSPNLAGLWDLYLGHQFIWFWEHLMDLQLNIKSACFLNWHLKTAMTKRKAIWL